MKTLRLIFLAISLHWDAQRSNPVNMLAAVVGMVINNSIVLFGLWAMLFSGKPNGAQMTTYFLLLNAMITISWGSTCFFLGGLANLAETVEEGALEPSLASPRHPLVLVAISQSLTPALGDLVQGSITLIAVCCIGGWREGLRCLCMIGVSVPACIGLFILIGSVPFFLKRGNQVALVLREICLSLSFYPTGKIFEDRMRWILWLTPAAAITVLPMAVVETWSVWGFLMALTAAFVLFAIGVVIFEFGLKRYQSTSYVTARS